MIPAIHACTEMATCMHDFYPAATLSSIMSLYLFLDLWISKLLYKAWDQYVYNYIGQSSYNYDRV